MKNKIKDILKNPSKYIKVYICNKKVFLMLTVSFISILENAVEEHEELERYRQLGAINEVETILKGKGQEIL